MNVFEINSKSFSVVLGSRTISELRANTKAVKRKRKTGASGDPDEEVGSEIGSDDDDDDDDETPPADNKGDEGDADESSEDENLKRFHATLMPVLRGTGKAPSIPNVVTGFVQNSKFH